MSPTGVRAPVTARRVEPIAGRGVRKLVRVEQRVADYLLRQVVHLRRLQSGSIARFGAGDGDDWPDLDQAEGAIAGLSALGLLDDAEARVWRERFAAEASGTRARDWRPAQEVHDRVVRYLIERIERLPSRSAGGFDASWPLQSLLNDFRHMGVLAEREMDRLFDRLGDRLDAGEPRRQDEPEVDCLCAELRRVLVGPPERHAGVRITCFEIYDDAVALRWHMVRLAPDESGTIPSLPDEVEGAEAALRAREPHFALHDDLGTDYCFQSGGGGGGDGRFSHRVRTGTEMFAPSVPPAASRLWAVHGEYRFEVPL